MPQVHKAEVVSPLSVIIQASEEIGPRHREELCE